jgi:hypothetical protein
MLIYSVTSDALKISELKKLPLDFISGDNVGLNFMFDNPSRTAQILTLSICKD